MKNFNKFAESVMITTAKPESDSVGEVTGCPCQDENPMDMFSQSAEDVLGNLGDVTQPDSDVGETGEIQSDSEEGSDVEIECIDTGMWVKFGEFEMIIPKHVAQAIKKHVMEKMMEKMSEESEDESGEDEAKEEHEANESDETEAKEEHAFDETEEDEAKEEHEASESDEEESEEEKDKKDVNEAFDFKHKANKAEKDEAEEDAVQKKYGKTKKLDKCKKCKNKV